MAKKITWTRRSIVDRINIYNYWLEQNKSNIYAKKLDQLFEKSADIISKFPNIGRQGNYRNVFTKVVRTTKYSIGYTKMKFKFYEYGILDNTPMERASRFTEGISTLQNTILPFPKSKKKAVNFFTALTLIT